MQRNDNVDLAVTDNHHYRNSPSTLKLPPPPTNPPSPGLVGTARDTGPPRSYDATPDYSSTARANGNYAGPPPLPAADADEYRAQYGRPSERRGGSDVDGDDDMDIGRLRAKNRSLQMELDDHASRLQLLKTDNDNLIQRLGDARKERERLEQELREKIREPDTARKQLEIDRLETELSRRTRAVDQLTADNSELTDKVRRLEADLSRRPAGDDVETRRLKMEVERLEDELRRRTATTDQQRQMEAKVEKLTRQTDIDYRKLQELVAENETLKKTRIPAEVEHELNASVDKLTNSVKTKDRQIDELNHELRRLNNSKSELDKDNSELQTTVAELRRELQRVNGDLEDARDCRDREVARLRADYDRVRVEKDSMQLTARGAGPGRDQLRPLQELVREQESHIVDLRREVETLREAVGDYQKELEHLHSIANADDVTREKFKDISGAHRRLLEENARLLSMLDQRQQAESKALTDKTDVLRNLGETKKRLEASGRRIAQLERWLDEIYNDKDFDVVQKRGPYARSRTHRAGVGRTLPKMCPAAMTDRRRAQIRQILGETGGANEYGSGYNTVRL